MKASEFENRAEYEVVMEHLMLGDKFHADNTPVYVKVFRHIKTEKGFQVDWKNGEYREAKVVIGNYGKWIKLEAE